ncbi:MAG: FHA domain-containing protein [bacterium]|nr:FHA domain-containing protein [bacterium]
MPRLDFFIEFKLFLRVSLGEETVNIGRSGDCEVQLTDKKVSRSHAVITVDDAGEYWIENRSSNGTRLNAAMLEEKTQLSSGDRVYIGDYVMIYHTEDAPPISQEQDLTISPD